MKRLIRTAIPVLLAATMLASCHPVSTLPASGARGDAVGIMERRETDDGDLLYRYATGSEYADVSFLTQPTKESATKTQYSKYPGDYANPAGDAAKYFPPLESVIAKGRGEVPIYGIYAWQESYVANEKVLEDIGFTCLRLSNSGAISDENLISMLNSGISVMITVGNGATTFRKEGARGLELSDYDVEAWIQYNYDTVAPRLCRFGPNGTLFRENPDMRYNPIRYVELYNEPNFGYMVGNFPADATDAEITRIKYQLYTALQDGMYARLKAEFPDVQIVGFGAGGENAADYGFIGAALKYSPGSAKTMDVLSTHPYINPGSPFSCPSVGVQTSLGERLSILRKTLSDAGAGDIPIWYTECGWQVPQSEGGKYVQKNTVVNQDVQAAMLVQCYVFGLRNGVERITYMYVIDTDNCNYGVVDNNGKMRIAGYAIKNMIELMPDPLIKRAILEGRDPDTGKLTHSYAYEFESKPGGEDVIIAFNAYAPGAITIPWEEPYAIVTDMLGTTKLVAAEDGALVLEDAGCCPMYVRHVTDTAQLDQILTRQLPEQSGTDATAALAWMDDRRYL